MDSLPIDIVLPELKETFRKHNNVVLSADPGAGKTTRVPLALRDEKWLAEKKVLMLEPRRLAAQRSAAYMARLLEENVGDTVGYRIRGDSKVGKRTLIEVVTEGILTRMLQNDPALPDVGIIIFDEFHERSIHTDLGLALALDVQQHLRPDLHLLVMSATIDVAAVSSLLDNAAIIKSEGRMFPVETIYATRAQEKQIDPLVVSTIHRALRETEGDLLVFLPGQREIRRIESLLREQELPPGTKVHMLFGDAPPQHQQLALAPAAAGTRKIILSTSIAETSLTIDGIRVVIDSGFARGPRFDPRRGMSGLVTTPVSKATADQRRGRAGRQQPGVCYRLWTEQWNTVLTLFPKPEILVADLASFTLELARWGSPEGKGLRFIDPPPAPHLSQARDLLTRLGAVNPEGKLTKHGIAMNDLPVHPRFAHMLLRGKELGSASLACDIAALLDERDLLRGKHDDDIDLRSRLHVLKHGGTQFRDSRDRVQQQSKRLRELLGVREHSSTEERLGSLVALAYPDRVGKQREKEGLKYQLAGGSGAMLPKESMLSREEYLAIADVDGAGNEVKVFLAAPLTEQDIKEAFSGQLTITEEVGWNMRQEAISAKQVIRFGTIELSHTQISPPAEKMISAMIEGIQLLGLNALPWTKEATSFRSRSEWLRAANLAGSDWPDLSDEHLAGSVDEWLSPYLQGITKRSHLERLDMFKIIKAMFSYSQSNQLDKLAPTHLTVPTGSHIPIDYSSGSQPVLAVRLQEMFGQTETPTVGGGKVKVLLHLLSPARRPLAVTQDLPSFWKNAYPDVRKDMRGKYPKHFWPENPLEAEPTRRVKKRQTQPH
jgi:ATP-dependent helicase HrpB